MTRNLVSRQTLSEMLLVYTSIACVMAVLLIVFGYISIRDTITYFIRYPNKKQTQHNRLKTHQLPLISNV